jgi:hypothetical protein
VPYSGPKGGGWKVAQVLVLLGRISPRFPETSYCDVEVGVPEVNWQGSISNERAQNVAANAADKAAGQVLTKRLVTAVLCDQFRQKMQTFMRDSQQVDYLPGATVSSFRPWRIEIEPMTFP